MFFNLRSPLAVFLVFAIPAGILPTITVHGQAAPRITGPEYPVISQPPGNKARINTYCNNLFVIEAATEYTHQVYFAFHYVDDRGQVEYEEAPLNDISLMVVPDPKPGISATPDAGIRLPKVTQVGADGDQRVWVLTITETTKDANALCLNQIPQKTSP